MKRDLAIFLAGVLMGATGVVVTGHLQPARPPAGAAAPPVSVPSRPVREDSEAATLPLRPASVAVSNVPVPPSAVSSPIPIQYLPLKLQGALQRYGKLTEPKQRIDLVKDVVGLTGSEAKGPEIANVLGQFLRQEDDADVKLEIIDDLLLLNEPAGFDQVLSALQAQQPPDVRLAAIQALANLDDTRARPLLLQLLSDSNGDVRRAAQQALDSLPAE